MKRKLLFFGLTLFLGVIIGITLVARLDVFTHAQGQNIKQESSTSAGTLTEKPNLEDAVINVANTVGKAVVSISTEHTAKIPGPRVFRFNYPFGGESPFGQDEPFRRFFDDYFGEMPDREFKQIGLGSGVIIDPKGYVLTNEHVIAEADKITVTFSDGREFKAEVKGRDSRSDLAVIKINADNLPAAKLGDSDSLKIGQWVVAIGNPFGFALENPEPTVTAGVISAMHRSLGTSIARAKDYNDLIQTDAAINPGNSGGPMVNLKGEVVGINVAIFSTTGGYQGIGFAVPINKAKRILSRLIEGKKISYGWLGITVQDLNEDLSKYFGLKDKNGVLVVKILQDSPAQKAGIKASDIIKQIDDKPVNNVRDVLVIVGSAESGRKIKITLLRDKKSLTVEAITSERPQEEELEGLTQKAESGTWRGLEVEALNPENMRRLGVSENKGVVVVEVKPNTPADSSRIIPGEIILEINKQPVNNLADYQKITGQLKGDALVKTSRGYFVIKEVID
jgi:serine protease Do